MHLSIFSFKNPQRSPLLQMGLNLDCFYYAMRALEHCRELSKIFCRYFHNTSLCYSQPRRTSFCCDTVALRLNGLISLHFRAAIKFTHTARVSCSFRRWAVPFPRKRFLSDALGLFTMQWRDIRTVAPYRDSGSLIFQVA